MPELENFHVLTLPSRCLPYDGVNPADVKARAYLGRDEIYLAEITPDNIDLKFLPVMKGAIKGLDPENMTLGDREYFILWEYIRSYSKMLGLELVCLNCGKEIEIQVDLSELDVTLIGAGQRLQRPRVTFGAAQAGEDRGMTWLTRLCR